MRDLPRCNLCWREFDEPDDEAVVTRCGHLFCARPTNAPPPFTAACGGIKNNEHSLLEQETTR